jgi:hypothetical protein
MGEGGPAGTSSGELFRLLNDGHEELHESYTIGFSNDA